MCTRSGVGLVEWPRTAPLCTSMTEWKPGKGNHRRGIVRGSKSGTRRGTLPAHRDPIIIGRRALAAPLWLAGNDGTTVLEHVNRWLSERSELPVGIDTVRRDKREIEAQWREDGADTISEARSMHIARLERLMVLLHEDYVRVRADGGNVVPIADQLRKIEMDLGAFDSSLAAARVHVSTDETAIERFLMSVREPLPPDALKLIPLRDDNEGYAAYRELPPPVRGDG
jgi:hypothetical protein